MHIFAFVVSFALFIAGFWVMGESFYVGPAFQGATFIGGILMSSLGFAIPVHVLKRIGD